MLTGFYQKRKKKLVKGIKILMKKKNQYLEHYKIFLKIKKDSRIKKKLFYITSKIIELKKSQCTKLNRKPADSSISNNRLPHEFLCIK